MRILEISCEIPLRLLPATGAFLVLAGFFNLSAAEPTSEEIAFFESEVRPLLVKHCYDCHSRDSEKIKGGLLLDSRDGWVAGGDSGDVIDPGAPEKSLLIETVRYDNPDLEMPPKYKLESREIEVLERWIAMGAPDPRVGGVPVAKGNGADIEERRRHWAFQPVRKSAVPVVKEADWARDDLDRFILSGIEGAGIRPVPDADRFVLIRRATLDLIGLPPTVEEVNAFVKDPSGDDEAFARVVDRLLQSEHFGERWGRHWLDVARYADSVGRTRNVPFPYAWRFRNYVIDSFNRDKPYHLFLGEQIAGDLMPARNQAHRDELLIATGFLALGSMDLNERDREQFMLDRVDDQVDTLGRAVLGLTTGCARCHDHKFDPLSQKDYYALAGIFSSTETLSGQINKGGGGDYTNTNLLVSLGSRTGGGSSDRAAAPQVAKVDAAAVAAARKRVNQLQVQVKNSKQAPKKLKEIQGQLKRAQQRLAALEKGASPSSEKKKGGKGSGPINPEALLAMSARDGKPSDLALRVRGEPDIKGELVPRGFPEALCSGTPPTLAREQSGRLELARWLADPEHPLTARVWVNRIWAHLFGRGIVPTLDNFGVAGEFPTHPELLDHLATRFVENGWSTKGLIRTLMLSRSYRMSSDPIASNSQVDESNRLFWRMNLRRMEAEVIRDSLLAAGGVLDPKRPSGSPFEGLSAAQLGKNGITRGSDKSFSSPVRSAYLPVFRSHLPGMFTVFDFAEPSMVNGQRDVTTVAPQALFLLNNEFVVKSSKLAADRILDLQLSNDAARIRYAYAFTLCRTPSDEEMARAGDFLETTGNWPAFIQALYSTAEFRYIR